MTSDEIRRRFLKFFESKNHKVIPSDSLIPANDPSVLFTSAGMNQFKEQFTGVNITFKRAASSQKCLRTGDIENVGRTAGHHTFFEMLGNFSFGDYFKKDAIRWAWEFMTEELELGPDRLWASVYKDDYEAYDIWKNDIKIPKRRIKRYGEHDNFWPADAPKNGPDGPCGPSSEIFYDQGIGVGCRTKQCEPSCSCDRFVEVWNLVFTQFNRTGKNKLTPLKNKNIDTGMGLERLTAVMQGVSTNFETDLFAPLVYKIRKLAEAEKKLENSRINAIADHIRAVCFLIGDGILPSNEERGYVERMLIRRAFRFGKELGIGLPFLYKLVPAATMAMKGQYPEIETMREGIADVVLNEEQKFQNTLEEGTNVLVSIISGLKKKKAKTISGRDIFRLYDTYGFPMELTNEAAKAEGLSIDMAGFDKLMEKQRKMARAKSKMKSSIFGSSRDEDALKKLSETLKPSAFVGYKRYECEATVIAIVGSGRRLKTAKPGDIVELILDKTPFYGESGGQAGDSGYIHSKKAKLKVNNTKKSGGLIVHTCEAIKGSVKEKERVKATVDKDSRLGAARNHTATHLLHYALRKVLGRHVKQAGSFVGKDKLRFDFAHFKAIEKRQVDRIEELVNELVREDIDVKAEHLDREEAKKKGAIALFGEKYGRKVRMVSVGDCSKELCGGTHLNSTGQIGLFRIVSESSIASGVRRIEALTGRMAYESMKKDEETIRDIAEVFKTSVKNAAAASSEAASKVKRLQNEISVLKSGRAMVNISDIIKTSKEIHGAQVISAKMENMDIPALRVIADTIRKKAGTSVIVLGSNVNGKVALVCAVSKELIDKGANANNIIKKVSRLAGGSGGGRADFAQAGSKNINKLENALDAVTDIVKECIKGKS